MTWKSIYHKIKFDVVKVDGWLELGSLLVKQNWNAINEVQCIRDHDKQGQWKLKGWELHSKISLKITLLHNIQNFSNKLSNYWIE